MSCIDIDIMQHTARRITFVLILIFFEEGNMVHITVCFVLSSNLSSQIFLSQKKQCRQSSRAKIWSVSGWIVYFFIQAAVLARYLRLAVWVDYYYRYRYESIHQTSDTNRIAYRVESSHTNKFQADRPF